MIETGFRFRHLVLELREGRFDPQAARLAAELAALMGLDISGRFTDDPDLGKLANLPFAREFRVTEQSWHRLDAERLGHSRALARAGARRAFSEAAAGARHRFEVPAEQPGEGPEKTNPGEDIVVVDPRGRAEEPLSHVLDIALRAAGAALLLPRRLARRHGPIAVIAATPDDPGIATASELAKTVGETLLPLGLMTDEPQHVEMTTRERLIVVRRGVLDDATLSVMVTRKSVPLLVLRSD